MSKTHHPAIGAAFPERHKQHFTERERTERHRQARTTSHESAKAPYAIFKDYGDRMQRAMAFGRLMVLGTDGQSRPAESYHHPITHETLTREEAIARLSEDEQTEAYDIWEAQMSASEEHAAEALPLLGEIAVEHETQVEVVV